MVVLSDDERQALIDALRVALARAEAMCERARVACTASRAVRALRVREQVRASRVLSPRGAARLMKDLETASRDLEMLKAKIESSKPPTRMIQLRRRTVIAGRIKQSCLTLSRWLFRTKKNHPACSPHVMDDEKDKRNFHVANLQVRELRPDEDATFRKIHHAAVHGLAAGHYPQAILDKWSAPIREGEGVQPRRRGQVRLVAELDGEPVGIGALFPDKSELDAVYVLPSAARKGVGTALIREIERIAVEKGVRQLHLDASLNAELFYLAMGYEVVERGEHVLNSGQAMACVRMAKDLTSDQRTLGKSSST